MKQIIKYMKGFEKQCILGPLFKLLEAGLEPAGILCSHAHIDHCGNSAYLQRKYGIPEALAWS